MPSPVLKKLKQGYLLEVTCVAGTWNAGLCIGGSDMNSYVGWAKSYQAVMGNLKRDIEKKDKVNK